MSIFRSSPSGKEAGELLRGVNLEVDALGRLNPCARSGRYFDWDYFCSGNNASGTIGRMGWTLLGTGTPAFTRISSTLSSPSKAILSTSNVNGNTSSLTLGDSTGKAVGAPVETVMMQWAWRMNNSLATKRVFYGWCNNFGINPNTSNVNAFGVFYDSSVSPNYIIINKNGNAFSQSFDTGVAVPQNSGQLFTIAKPNPLINNYDIVVATDSAGSVSEQYLARDVSLAAIVPTGYTANLGFFMATLAGVVSSLELGCWNIATNAFPVGAFADASFLLDV